MSRDSDGPRAVDVVIVNYRTPDLTTQAVNAVAGAGVTFWVRDNSGELDQDSLRVAARGRPLDLRAEGGNLLYAAGNNAMYERGNAPYVLLLNPDVQLTHGGLCRLVHALESDQQLWAVVPQLLNVDGTPQDYYRRLPGLATILCDRMPALRRLLRRTWARHVYADEDMTMRRSLEAPPGACLLVRRSHVGHQPFDEQLSLFYNDTDLCLRMRDAGLRVDLVAEVTATHIRGASLEQARSSDKFVVARLYDRNCLAFAKKHFRAWPVLLPVLLLRRAVEPVLRVAGS